MAERTPRRPAALMDGQSRMRTSASHATRTATTVQNVVRALWSARNREPRRPREVIGSSLDNQPTERQGKTMPSVTQPSNFERGDRAAGALTAAGYNDGSPQEHDLCLLIADLCQLAQRNGWNIAELLTMGLCIYGSQCVDQAFDQIDEPIDDWPDAAYVEHAERVLRVCGVPESVHERVYRCLDLLA